MKCFRDLLNHLFRNGWKKNEYKSTMITSIQFKVRKLYHYAWSSLKGCFHLKINILSSFTHRHVAPNLCTFFSVKSRKIHFEKWLIVLVFFPHTIELSGYWKQFGYQNSSKYLLLCSAEKRKSHRFRTTWEQVNDDRYFIFGWIIPLRQLSVYL